MKIFNRKNEEKITRTTDVIVHRGSQQHDMEKNLDALKKGSNEIHEDF